MPPLSADGMSAARQCRPSSILCVHCMLITQPWTTSYISARSLKPNPSLSRPRRLLSQDLPRSPAARPRRPWTPRSATCECVLYISMKTLLIDREGVEPPLATSSTFLSVSPVRFRPTNGADVLTTSAFHPADITNEELTRLFQPYGHVSHAWCVFSYGVTSLRAVVAESLPAPPASSRFLTRAHAVEALS